MTVKDLVSLMWSVCHRLLMLLGQESAKIMTREMDIAPKTMSRIIKQDLGLSNDKEDSLTVALKENRGKKSRCLLALYFKEHYKEILFTD